MARLAKRTYTLPSDLVQRLEQRLSPGERSRFIAKLIEGWLEEKDRETLRAEIIAGCRDMAELYQEIDQSWTEASDETWHEY